MSESSGQQGGDQAHSAVADRNAAKRKGRSAKGGERVSKTVSKSASKSAGSASTISARRGQGSTLPFLQMYKPSQGYYTRLGTSIGAGVLALGMGKFVYDNLTFDQNWAPGLYLKTGIPVVVVALAGVMIWWVVGVHRRSVDFLIATDGEMKKVNWSSKRELIASTKVVIVVTVMMAVVLFLVDLGFMRFFQWIGVLRSGGPS